MHDSTIPSPDSSAAEEHVCGPGCTCGCATGLTIPVRMSASSSSVPTPAGNCSKCGGQMYSGLTHHCPTTAIKSPVIGNTGSAASRPGEADGDWTAPLSGPDDVVFVPVNEEVERLATELLSLLRPWELQPVEVKQACVKLTMALAARGAETNG